MASDLTRGAYSGRETYLYYNSATNATPTWTQIVRARNIQFTDGPSLTEIEFHGAAAISSIPGYEGFSGSFEYVRRRGTDAVYSALLTAMRDGDPLEFQFLNNTEATAGAIGWRAPVLLGQFQETANGSDGVVVTIPFALADAYDANGDVVVLEDVEISA